MNGPSTLQPRRRQLHDAIDADYDSIAKILVTKKANPTPAPSVINWLMTDWEFSEEFATDIVKRVTELVQADQPKSVLEQMRALHHAVVNVELNAPTTPDGYPTSTIGASDNTTPAPAPEYDDDGNLLEPVELTPTERAAHAAAHHRTDEYRRKVRKANEFLQQAAMSLRAVDNSLRWCIDKPNLVNPRENDAVCWAMKRVGVNEPVARRIVVDGNTIPLCAWAYNFRVRQRRLPTIEECQMHAKGRRVMIAS